MKKIVHIIIGLNRGGAETMLFRLVSRTKENNEFQHIVISMTDLGYFGSKLQSLGINVCCLNIKNIIFYYPYSFVRLIKILRSLNPDVVQTWMYHADLIGGIAAKIAKIKIILWGIHSVKLDKSSSHITFLIRGLCAIFSYIIPSRILCVANTSILYHKKLGYHSKLLSLLPNGFEIPNLENSLTEAAIIRKRWDIDSNTVIIGTVGRYHPDKDYFNFLSAASLIIKEIKNVKFIMIGSGLDESNSELVGLIKDFGVQNHIVLMGPQSGINKYYAAFDIFCLSSKTEAFPLVIGEAMAMGKICICTDVGDAKVLLGDNNLLVKKESPGDLANTLSHYLKLKYEGRNSIGLNLRKRIENLYSMDKYIQEINKFYSNNNL